MQWCLMLLKRSCWPGSVLVDDDVGRSFGQGSHEGGEDCLLLLYKLRLVAYCRTPGRKICPFVARSFGSLVRWLDGWMVGRLTDCCILGLVMIFCFNL